MSTENSAVYILKSSRIPIIIVVTRDREVEGGEVWDHSGGVRSVDEDPGVVMRDVVITEKPTTNSLDDRR